MAILLHHINYRNIQLTASGESESVPVKLKNGEYRYLRWRGFLEVEEAKKSPGIPVKIRVKGYSIEDFQPQWVALEEDQHIQGCLLFGGVYGVLTGKALRIV